ncbi:hypothetical protein AN1V17_02530 [Vallitalea sediminicola]
MDVPFYIGIIFIIVIYTIFLIMVYREIKLIRNLGKVLINFKWTFNSNIIYLLLIIAYIIINTVLQLSFYALLFIVPFIFYMGKFGRNQKFYELGIESYHKICKWDKIVLYELIQSLDNGNVEGIILYIKPYNPNKNEEIATFYFSEDETEKVVAIMKEHNILEHLSNTND